MQVLHQLGMLKKNKVDTYCTALSNDSLQIIIQEKVMQELVV